ncbi:MAG: 4-(cytidine 5'-diphospho)-2-C-methyl-D-erythritol kinase, partial [Candidatus Kapaibacterium sp.]
AVRNAFSIAAGAKITIDKHIPLGAGLGGGSSDAASALLALRSLWKLPCSIDDLRGIAKDLGADVSFFMGCDDALAGGVGDRLRPLALRLPYSVLLVFPGVEVSTAHAYGMLHRGSEPRTASPLVETLDLLAAARGGHVRVRNDFQQVVFAEHPLLGRIAAEMETPACTSVFMSGSGSTIVGLYGRREDALRQSKALSDVRSCVCSFVHHIEDDLHR